MQQLTNWVVKCTRSEQLNFVITAVTSCWIVSYLSYCISKTALAAHRSVAPLVLFGDRDCMHACIVRYLHRNAIERSEKWQPETSLLAAVTSQLRSTYIIYSPSPCKLRGTRGVVHASAPHVFGFSTTFLRIHKMLLCSLYFDVSLIFFFEF